jgi:hypothetical protein
MAAAPVRDSNGTLPVGNYIGYVAKVTVGPFKDDPDNPIFTVTLRALGGEHHGETQRKSYFIADSARFGYFKTDMARFGVDVNNLGMTWSQWVYYKHNDLLRRTVKFANVETAKDEKKYLNTYINDPVTVEIPADLLALDFPASKAASAPPPPAAPAPPATPEADASDIVDPFRVQ